MASFAGEVLISATSGVFAHKPPIRPENAKESGTDQIVVIVIVVVVVAMVVGVVSSPIWHRHGRGGHHRHGDHGKNDNNGRVRAIYLRIGRNLRSVRCCTSDRARAGDGLRWPKEKRKELSGF